MSISTVHLYWRNGYAFCLEQEYISFSVPSLPLFPYIWVKKRGDLGNIKNYTIFGLFLSLPQSLQHQYEQRSIFLFCFSPSLSYSSFPNFCSGNKEHRQVLGIVSKPLRILCSINLGKINFFLPLSLLFFPAFFISLSILNRQSKYFSTHFYTILFINANSFLIKECIEISSLLSVLFLEILRLQIGFLKTAPVRIQKEK